MQQKTIWIAIDGPAASGKSSIANKLTELLKDFIHINTGSMYRAIGYFFHLKNIDINDENEINKNLSNVDIYLENNENIFILFDNQKLDVTNLIHNEKIAKITSKISSYLKVREKLIEYQRKIIQGKNVIMDGRDIGTVVIPNATLKIYLDSSIQIRAERRVNQLGDKDINLEDIKKDIASRDYNDTNRKIMALAKADDAILINTDNLTIDQCCEKIISLLNERILN